MENTNILDTDILNIGDEDATNIFQMTSDISELVDNISSGGVDAVRYPIEKYMHKDVIYHTREHHIVCIHLCVYQRQVDSRKRPFIQYYDLRTVSWDFTPNHFSTRLTETST